MSHSPPTDDSLVINRQKDVRELLSQAIYVSPWGELDDSEIYRIEKAAIALGVGKPDPVRESDLQRAAHRCRTSPGVPYSTDHDIADRIERAIGGGDG